MIYKTIYSTHVYCIMHTLYMCSILCNVGVVYITNFIIVE